MGRYNKQVVTLKTNEGMASTKKVLIDIWKMRIKQYFPHYRLVIVKLDKYKGKKQY